MSATPGDEADYNWLWDDRMPIADQAKKIAEEGPYDYLGLWQIVGWARRHFSPPGVDETRATSLEVVRSLMRDAGAQAGDIAPNGGLSPWPLTRQQALARIEQEWDALGRDPEIGYIAWFNIPDPPAQEEVPR